MDAMQYKLIFAETTSASRRRNSHSVIVVIVVVGMRRRAAQEKFRVGEILQQRIVPASGDRGRDVGVVRHELFRRHYCTQPRVGAMGVLT